MKFVSITEINKLTNNKLSLRNFEELLPFDLNYQVFIKYVDGFSKTKCEKEIERQMILTLPAFVDPSELTLIYEKQNKFQKNDEYYICAFYNFDLDEMIRQLKLQAFL